MNVNLQDTLHILEASTPQDIQKSCNRDIIQAVKDRLEQALDLLPEDPSQNDAAVHMTRAKARRKPPTYDFVLDITPACPGVQLYRDLAQYRDKFQAYLTEGPAILDRHGLRFNIDAVLHDIERFMAAGDVDCWRGIFALLELLDTFERGNYRSAGEFSESITHSDRWQTVRHGLSDARKIRLITKYGGQGMCPLLAFSFRKWRYMSEEQVESFTSCCHKDAYLAGLLAVFASTLPTYRDFYLQSISLTLTVPLTPDVVTWGQQFGQSVQTTGYIPDITVWAGQYHNSDVG